MEGDERVVFVPCNGSRLDIHFGLGRELLICDLNGAANSTSTSIIWGSQSPARRQAAFDALPHVEALQAQRNETTMPALHRTVSSISDALLSAASAQDAAEDGGDSHIGLEAAVWDLVMLLFIDHGATDGYIGEALSKWTCKHAVFIGAGLESDCTQYVSTPPYTSSIHMLLHI